jgi:hypothetical protein
VVTECQLHNRRNYSVNIGKAETIKTLNLLALSGLTFCTVPQIRVFPTLLMQINIQKLLVILEIRFLFF